MTCDVEEFSIEHSTVHDSVIPKVHKQGLPLLLDIFDRQKIKATFFFTGYYAKRSPTSLLMAKEKGHEIGCHSYSHKSRFYLNRLSAKEQYKEISKAKFIIEKIVGPIKSFRSPALRSNKHTFEVLMKCGFSHDSSICPRRFDAFLTPGALREKLKWLNQSRSPFKIKSIYSSKNLIEVPLSSLVLPYMSNISRISPSIMEIIQKQLFSESSKNKNHLMFLTHPNEFVDLSSSPKTTYRSDYLIGNFLTDFLRHRLKLQRFGPSFTNLVENEIIAAKKLGFQFKTIDSVKI